MSPLSLAAVAVLLVLSWKPGHRVWGVAYKFTFRRGRTAAFLLSVSSEEISEEQAARALLPYLEGRRVVIGAIGSFELTAYLGIIAAGCAVLRIFVARVPKS